MITVGEEQLKELFVGEMGIKKAYIGEEPIYTRPAVFIHRTERKERSITYGKFFSI